MEEDMLLAQAVTADTAQSAAPGASVPGWLQPLRQRIAACIDTCADYNAAVAIYEELAGLSNAELRRRGLSRDTLARDVCTACDRMG
jgi:hypothetical protein